MAFDGRHGLGLCDLTNYVAQSHTPQAHCVRFGRAVTGRTRNTRYQAARYALPGRDLPPLDRAGFIPAHAGLLRNLEASVRSRGTVVDHWLDRDLIEAGLSEPAGWRASYGDCVCGGWSESPRRVSGAAISTG
jgi:hypothetical protein